MASNFKGIKGKRGLCSIEKSNFTDIQAIGQDPIYLRYNSIKAVVDKYIDPQYHSFLAEPEYVERTAEIAWYADDWGSSDVPTPLKDAPERIDEFEAIVKHYRDTCNKLSGNNRLILEKATRYINEDFAYCIGDNIVLAVWGMKPNPYIYRSVGKIVQEFNFGRNHMVTFDAGEKGRIDGRRKKSVRVADGGTVSSSMIPEVKAQKGYTFDGWSPDPFSTTINKTTTFQAQYSAVAAPEPDNDNSNNDSSGITNDNPTTPPVPPTPPEPPIDDDNSKVIAEFNAGHGGHFDDGSNRRTVPVNRGEYISTWQIPQVTPYQGYNFEGWNPDPTNEPMQYSTTYNAQYSEIVSDNIVTEKRTWWQRVRDWWGGLWHGDDGDGRGGCWQRIRGCLWILLALLLLALILWLCSWLLKDCSCSCDKEEKDTVEQVDKITTDDGREVDNNGTTQPITDDSGTLPDSGNAIVSPVVGDGGAMPPIVEQPGMPSIIGNRLFLFMEDANGDIDALAQDFKKAYPGDQYKIIGFDREVKSLVIEIPAEERDAIRKSLNSQLPNHSFFVFDEEVYELSGNQGRDDPSLHGWHIKAINLQQGWETTRGQDDIIVAVVDDGIDANHDMFKGRITNPYNVFRQDNHLSQGDGHGTHTAALAAGSAQFIDKGATGVAPECRLMPVQVFDNGMCPLSALVSGVMYAIHHEADAVNISIGPSFQGLNMLPEDQQDEIARNTFRNTQMLWERVCSIAASKKCILVFAAGNDNILAAIPPENRTNSAIVVSAVNSSLKQTDFTNYGEEADISAPGEAIYSAFPGNSFQSMDGTSMAAPIVTGTVALMKCINKEITVKQARYVLQKTGAAVTGDVPVMVQVDKALQTVKNGDYPADSEIGDTAPSPSVPADTTTVEPGRSDEVKQPAEQDSGTDYDEIRRQIREHEKRIDELKKLLPENQK
ncbi:MAG TPA: S8 family serine peptidase [Candidatus Avimuribaculum pullicola]|nr:S8 family serine peptidase [Candidatus Avimuribaculum pullicola]